MPQVNPKPQWLERAEDWGYRVFLLADIWKYQDEVRRKIDVYAVEWVNNEAKHDEFEQRLGDTYTLEAAKEIVQNHVRKNFLKDYKYIFEE